MSDSPRTPCERCGRGWETVRGTLNGQPTEYKVLLCDCFQRSISEGGEGTDA